MNYLATFHTHYGAMCFQKYCEKNGIAAKMTPTPRELSASCGVCVRFDSTVAPDAQDHEDMDRCYAFLTDGGYAPLEG